MRLIDLRIVVLSALLLAAHGQAQPLVWSNTLAEAQAAARSQGKLVLLIGGRPDCTSCAYVRGTVCEVPSVRAILDEIYVPWYSDIDVYQDYKPFEDGLSGYTLPLICMIEPDATNAWLRRQFGLVTPGAFAGHLKSAATRSPPRPLSLTNHQVLTDRLFEVQGSVWPILDPAEVWYQVGLSGSQSGPWALAAGTTPWTISLAPYLESASSNRFDLRLYTKFSDGTRSPTNDVTFYFDPWGVPSVPPTNAPAVLDALERTSQGFRFRVAGTEGAGYQVERAASVQGPWRVVAAALLIGADGLAVYQDSNAPPDRAFYRARPAP